MGTWTSHSQAARRVWDCGAVMAFMLSDFAHAGIPCGSMNLLCAPLACSAFAILSLGRDSPQRRCASPSRCAPFCFVITPLGCFGARSEKQIIRGRVVKRLFFSLGNVNLVFRDNIYNSLRKNGKSFRYKRRSGDDPDPCSFFSPFTAGKTIPFCRIPKTTRICC